MGVSIHAVILENTDSEFVISEEETYVGGIWDAFPRHHTRTQLSRAQCWSDRQLPAGLQGSYSAMWAVLLCVRKGQVGTSSDDKALKLKPGSVLYESSVVAKLLVTSAGAQ